MIGAADTVTGTITAPDGSGITNATVTATNVDTKVAVTTGTTSDGSYVISDLAEGVYKVAVKASGFKTFTAKKIDVHGPEGVELDARLKQAKPSFVARLLVAGTVLAADAYLQHLQDQTDDSQDDGSASVDQDATPGTTGRENHNFKANDKDHRKDEGRERAKDRDKDNDKRIDRRRS
jgi:hypothetical protein